MKQKNNMWKLNRMALALGIMVVMALSLTAQNQDADEGRAPEITLDVVVKNEQGEPLAGVEVRAYFSGPFASGPDKAETDNDGRVTLRGKATLRASVSSGGKDSKWYRSSSAIIPGGIDPDKDGWEIKGEGTLVLREKKNPVPLVARRMNLKLPSIGSEYGFDLEVGDWMPPHGTGEKAMMFFRGDIKNDERGGSVQRISVSFPNEKDGSYAYKSSESVMQSTYKWPYMASNDLDAYETRKVWERIKLPEGAVQKSWDLSEGYIFRINTVVKNKKIISANYGKISPGVELVGSSTKRPGCKFVYFYNPTPNDRNLEFDPDKNLAKDGPRVWMEQFGL